MALTQKVDKVEGKALSTNDYTNEEKGQVAKIGGKQDTLTLTVKDNGNIVIGNIAGQTKEFMSATPSGDPLHYAYIDAGAKWSSSTGYWSLNGLTDITTEEMREIYNVGFIGDLSHNPLCGLKAKIRTNLLRVGGVNYNFSNESIKSLAYDNNVIEIINLKTTNGQYEDSIYASDATTLFYGCTNLKAIYGNLRISGAWTNTFYNCANLQRVRIGELKKSIDFSDCPNIDKDSVLYAIDKSVATSAITITLHPTAYAKYSADSDIVAALSSKTYVTLISA